MRGSGGVDIALSDAPSNVATCIWRAWDDAQVSIFAVESRVQKDLFISQPKNQEEASEPVSVEIDFAPKLTLLVSKVAEKVEIFTSLVIKIPQDNAHPTVISPQTPIPIMDLRLRNLASIGVSRLKKDEVTHWFIKIIINYLVPVSTFLEDTRESIDVCAASQHDMALNEGSGHCSGDMGVHL